MAIPLFELLIDAVLAALLLTTLVYCIILNRRIRVLQDGKGELARVLKHFDESTRRASDSISVLQTTGRRVAEIMETRMERATQLSDDINYLVDQAEKIANRLEAGINIGRSTRKVQEEEKLSPPPKKASSDEEALVRAAVQAALEENKALPQSAPVRPTPASAPTPKAPGNGPLQAMIEKIANRTASDPSLRGQRAAKFPETRARSRVEQELLEIIRAEKG